MRLFIFEGGIYSKILFSYFFSSAGMQEEGKDDKGNSKKKSGIRGVGRLFFASLRGARMKTKWAPIFVSPQKNGKSRGDKYGFPVIQVRWKTSYTACIQIHTWAIKVNLNYFTHYLLRLCPPMILPLFLHPPIHPQLSQWDEPRSAHQIFSQVCVVVVGGGGATNSGSDF